MSAALMHYARDVKQSYSHADCPDYKSAVSRSDTTNSGRSVHWHSSGHSSEESSVAPLSLRKPTPPLNKESYIYTYKLLAGSAPLEFFISVEPLSGKPLPGQYTFRLSMKANGVERDMGEAKVLTLSVDPRNLDFVVFVFPAKSSVPAGCLYSLRVWMRVNGTDHRLFADDEVWVGKDLDFHSVADVSFMLLRNLSPKSATYHGHIGRALVTFVCRWHRVKDNLYKYSLDYDANGVGANLFEDLMLRIDGDPRTVTLLIYSVPMNSTPSGSSHRIRVWTKSLVSIPSSPSPFQGSDSYIYQRLWKSDTFKLGARLNFEAMADKMTMGFSSGPPRTIVDSTNATMSRTPPQTLRRQLSS